MTVDEAAFASNPCFRWPEDSGEGVCLELRECPRVKGVTSFLSFDFVQKLLEFHKLRPKRRVFAKQHGFQRAVRATFSAPFALWLFPLVEPVPTCGSDLARTQTTRNSIDLVRVEAMNTTSVHAWKQLDAFESTHGSPALL